MSTLLLAELTVKIQKLESQRAQLQEDAEKHRKDAMTSVVQKLIEQSLPTASRRRSLA